MKITIKNLLFSECNNTYLLNMEIIPKEAEKVKKIIDSEKQKEIELKLKSNKRSLEANSYCWLLVNKIAIKLNSTDKEIYKTMLRDYGTKEYLIGKIELRKELLKAYRIVEVVKDVYVNGKHAKLFRCIRGSSTYDSKEMSIMVNGVVDEAKAQSIETITPKELEIMMKNYRGV